VCTLHLLSTHNLQDQRFAAKEACRKACDHLDPNSRGFQSIMILPVTSPAQGGHLSSRPQGLILDGSYKIPVSSARDDSIDMGIVKKVFTYVDVNQLDGQLCELSISHDGNYATAVAIVPFPVAAAEKTREISQRFDSASQKLTGEEESF
jgi:holo-[acyl-carrier protein] synthase